MGLLQSLYVLLYGAIYLVKHYPSLVECDIVLTELGAFSNHLDGMEYFPILLPEALVDMDPFITKTIQ